MNQDQPIQDLVVQAEPTTMGEFRTQSPVLAPKTQKSDIAKANVSDYIPPSLIRYRFYDYETGKEFKLSKTETIVADAYIKTDSVEQSVRAINHMFQKHGSPRHHTAKGVRAWLQRPHVARYVAKKQLSSGKINWFDEESWKAWSIDVLNGKIDATTVQTSVWKEYGKSQGWYKEAASGPIANSLHINFTQSSGQA